MKHSNSYSVLGRRGQQEITGMMGRWLSIGQRTPGENRESVLVFGGSYC